MEKIEVYESYVNSDLTEGKGVNVHVAYFRDRFSAEMSVKGKDVMGGNGNVKLVTLIIYDDMVDFVRNNNEAVKKRALNKLTAEERQALGYL